MDAAPRPGAIPLLRDLPADQARMKAGHMPMLLLFSRSDCPYCAQVRTNYLHGLARDDAGVLVREVVSDYANEMIHADTTISHADFTRRYGVLFYPTLYFFDGDLRQVAEPLVGADKAGFYGGYLDARIEQAKAAAAR